ncbi:hypothetical protein KTR9_5236 (plasmid) [Gordonia sp. KTR9]|nr:hypothetical protein KTR9_5236 [Gordonia sp. KTR9]
MLQPFCTIGRGISTHKTRGLVGPQRDRRRCVTWLCCGRSCGPNGSRIVATFGAQLRHAPDPLNGCKPVSRSTLRVPSPRSLELVRSRFRPGLVTPTGPGHEGPPAVCDSSVNPTQ